MVITQNDKALIAKREHYYPSHNVQPQHYGKVKQEKVKPEHADGLPWFALPS